MRSGKVINIGIESLMLITIRLNSNFGFNFHFTLYDWHIDL